MLLVGDAHGKVSVYQMRNVPEPQEDPVSEVGASQLAVAWRLNGSLMPA